MNKLVGTLLVAAMIGSVLLVAPASQATYPGGNGPIAFASFSDSLDIASVNPDGSVPGLLLGEPGFDEYSPSYSADGSKVVFERSPASKRADIYIANSDGTGMQQLTSTKAFELIPTLSPNGQMIAYTRLGKLWMMNSDGTDQHMVDTGGEVDSSRIGFSPDGSKLVFVALDENYNGSLALYDLATDIVSTILVFDTAQGYAPAFSPDGTRIAYLTGFDAPGVRVVNVDGTGDQAVPLPFANVFSFDWSPDGTMFAVAGGTFKNPAISTVGIDGAGATELLSGFASALAWQPCTGDCTIVGPRGVALSVGAEYKKKKKKIEVSARAFPTIAGLEIKLTLKRKAPGAKRFRKVGTKTDTTNAEGVVSVRFGVKAKGRCKSIVKFLGSADYLPDTAKWTQSCSFSFPFRAGSRR